MEVQGMQYQGSSPRTHRPPPPPPLPILSLDVSNQKGSSIALKVRSAPPGWAFEGHVERPTWDFLTPPAGTYFFYGTLQDPAILGEILDSPSTPVLRPAHLIGYEMKLWGQYPALVDSIDTVVQGSAFEVPDEATAEKLACYETRNYHPQPCIVRFADGSELKEGYVFKFCGNPNDLTESSFDLDVWLKHMRRK